MKRAKSLIQIQEALDGVVSALQHLPEDSVKNARIATRALLGKSGMVGGAALGLQTATLVGTASTGTAISSLSGAALYSSQMAWLGFGSMAVGGIILVGIGAASGAVLNSAYTRLYAGKHRKPDRFSKDELELYLSAQNLSKELEALVACQNEISDRDRIILSLEGLAPIARQILRVIKLNTKEKTGLATKPRFALRRHYFALMIACEEMAHQIDSSRTKNIIGNRGDYLGIDFSTFQAALTEVADKDRVRLRTRYLKFLSEGEQGNPVERFEKVASEKMTASFNVAGSQLKIAGEFTTKHAPAFGDAAAERVSAAWSSLNLPQVTDQETLKRRARASAKFVKSITGDAKNGAVSTWVKTVKEKDRLLGKAFELKNRAPETRTKRLSMSASVVLAVTFQKLLSEEFKELSLEEDMVLKALRVAIPDLEHASASKLSDYLQSHQSEEQMRGIISATKGKYHELLYVDSKLAAGENVVMHEALNHAGSDVVFTMEDGTVQEVQLKAVADPQAINEHLERYPSLEIRTTEEVAAIMGIQSTGFSNSELSENVKDRLAELDGESFIDNVVDAGVTSIVVRGALSSRRILRGEFDQKEVVEALRDTSIAVGAGAILEQILVG